MPVSIGLLVVRWRGSEKVPNDDSFRYSDIVIDGILSHLSSKASMTMVIEVGVHSALDFARARIDVLAAMTQLDCDHRGALYFLWPSGSPREQLTRPGYVPQAELFSLMEEVEASGLPSIWPSASHIYKELVGKSWVPRVALASLGSPPTVAVRKEAVLRDATTAATNCLASLAAHSCTSDGSDDSIVVKLPYSWECEDVRRCRKLHPDLNVALSEMLLRDGTHDICLVQAFVPSVLEIRFHTLPCQLGSIKVCDVRHTRYRRSCTECGAFTHFQDMVDASLALLERQRIVSTFVFGGDVTILQDLELQACVQIEKLLVMLKADWGSLPSYLRFDFLVERMSNGCYMLWLNEIGELGSSLIGWKGTQKILDEVFLDFVKRSQCNGGEDCACRNGNLYETRAICSEVLHSTPRYGLHSLASCEGCANPDDSARECDACGAMICDTCTRKGYCRKLAHCKNCNHEVCKQCVHRSRRLAWSAIAMKHAESLKQTEATASIHDQSSAWNSPLVGG